MKTGILAGGLGLDLCGYLKDRKVAPKILAVSSLDSAGRANGATYIDSRTGEESHVSARVVVLAAMVARIGDLGWTPNRVAALGLNLVLLVNLAGAALLYRGATGHCNVYHALGINRADNRHMEVATREHRLVKGLKIVGGDGGERQGRRAGRAHQGW